MKNLLFLLTILFLISCSVEYEKQREMILSNVQTLEEGNILDLKAEIISLELDTIVTTQDSLNEYIKEWDYEYEGMVEQLAKEHDSVLNIMSEMTKKLNYDAKDLSALSINLENTEMQIGVYKKAMQFTIPYRVEDPYKFKQDLESRNATYNIYNCTYKAFNPALRVDQTLTKHFVFNESQTKIIRSY